MDSQENEPGIGSVQLGCAESDILNMCNAEIIPQNYPPDSLDGELIMGDDQRGFVESDFLYAPNAGSMGSVQFGFAESHSFAPI